MRSCGLKLAGVVAALCVLLLTTLCDRGFAQVVSNASKPTSETLDIRGSKAQTWSSGGDNIVLLQGPVVISGDRTRMTADTAVIWLTAVPGSVLGEQQADIALVGNANLQQQDVMRSGDRFFVTISVRGTIDLTAEDRATQDQSDSPVYRDAALLRPADRFPPGTVPAGDELLRHPPDTQPTSGPTTAPATQPLPTAPVSFRAANFQSVETPDNKVAFALSGGVVLFQSRITGEFIEVQADRAVVFTPRSSLRGMTESKKYEAAEEAIESAYLEGDVRITFTPAPPAVPGGKQRGEQRLTGNRVYYDFTTDRAVLTDAVVHTVDPKLGIPMVVRAQLVRQMSLGEYQTNKVELSSSTFATPSYSVKADRAYVRMVETGDPRYGAATDYVAHDATMRLYGMPAFYLPVVSGSMTERGSALRSIYTESSSRNGTGVRSTWGLFETLGILPPEDLDLSYHVDYLSSRGPGTGLDGSYMGGFINETTKQPWDFQGKFSSYIIHDDGTDRLGSERRLVTPDRQLRGRLIWEHQHFFPDDWQAQFRLGYASDPTFLEEWYQQDFDTSQPNDASIYLKHQRDTEAFTFLTEIPTRQFATNADELQEGAEVAKYPELGYHRIGDSFGDDRFTFFSDDGASALHFVKFKPTIADLGFRKGDSPGFPSYGETGENDNTTLRGDLRQEVDYPFAAGQFKVVPYVFGRYTGYSDSPQGDEKERFFAGTGVRINTAFWKVDDSAYSDLFDIHRIRHVIQPEINLFTTGTTVDRNQLFDYEEQVDKLNDVTGAQLALHQEWQTKRGGAGQFRSVDFLTLNVEANFFNNQPNDALLNPTGFRGLFFPSAPEVSVPRNSINADSLWRVSDTTAILADEQYNLDQNQLATASVGVAIQRDVRLAYFLGLRYIGQVNSTVASVATTYQLSSLYTVSLSESLDLGSRKSEDSSFTLIRHFDRFFASLTLYYDQINQQSGIRFGLIPEGLDKGVSSQQINNTLGVQ